MFQVLRCLCRSYSIIPPAYNIRSGSLRKIGEHALEFGGHADVWRGEYLVSGTGWVSVALKAIRINAGSASRIRSSVCQEVIMWRRLRHPRIIPMLGVDTELFPVCIVSEWAEHGTITAFLKRTPAANRLKLLVDVAEGLQYLHSETVAHGDLKSSNILIDSTLHARLCDFGLTTLIHSINTIDPATRSNGGQGTVQYMAPEIMDPESFGLRHAHASLEGDIYTLAIVMWEVFAGRPPYGSWHVGRIQREILRGTRPSRVVDALSESLGLSNSVWDLMERCWRSDPGERPPIGQVLPVLTYALATSKPGHWQSTRSISPILDLDTPTYSVVAHQDPPYGAREGFVSNVASSAP
ncbi:kinase-like domain-containing protein [Fomitopsis serialis]|uniref:kinase-like domain-containing protein n=1 Tax=Fomitopsis serialis TaxID=139415 RepID=UPI002008966C|nr:kinase-like domain-containing protein [Neoantrodia serialis]KAH9929157.1 kinase-like domain-containing protein [Neoantrodia serialis]